jgi:hypothetical protein
MALIKRYKFRFRLLYLGNNSISNEGCRKLSSANWKSVQIIDLSNHNKMQAITLSEIRDALFSLAPNL